MLTAGQQAAWYYARRRRRLHNAGLVVMLQPRSATLSHSASTATARTVSGVKALDNEEGTTGLSLSGADAADFQLSGNNLQLKSGVTLTADTPKVVQVDGSNDVKGDAHNIFTLTVT